MDGRYTGHFIAVPSARMGGIAASGNVMSGLREWSAIFSFYRLTGGKL
jgi:hypothetical protein